ncbi:hypothetical protein [Fundidesulfovibrio butyratiphilus]
MLVPLAHIKGISMVEAKETAGEATSGACPGGYRFRVMLGGDAECPKNTREGLNMIFDQPDQAEAARRELATRLEEFYERLIRLRAMIR